MRGTAYDRWHAMTSVAATPQKLLYIANALVDQYIGIEETDDGVWAIFFRDRSGHLLQVR